MPAQPTPAESIAELKELIVSYGKQEVLGPLRGIPRYLARGLAGALCVGIGLLLLSLAGLRALQTETGSTFTGSWSWAPYLIVLLGLIVAIAILGSLITRSRTTR